jgi:hypothetical protein
VATLEAVGAAQAPLPPSDVALHPLALQALERLADSYWPALAAG